MCWMLVKNVTYVLHYKTTMVNLNMARKSEKVQFSNSGLCMVGGGGLGDQSDV